MNCIIIEDQAPAQRVLKRYIADLDSLVLKGSFTNAVSALEFMKTEEVDLVFLDIHLPKISGIEFLKTLDRSPAVILTTAFPDYAVQSYEYDVVDYLVKPFSFERFLKAVTKAERQINKSEDRGGRSESSFFIKSGHEYIHIQTGEILFIKSDMDYTEINLPGKKYLSQETLSSWEEILGGNFVRVHKSHLVNIEKIEKVVGNQIYLPFDQRVPIGRAYKEAFFDQLVNRK